MDIVRFSVRTGFALMTAVISLALCCALFLSGYTNNYYLRLTSPRQASMVVGTSRAAQGIRPAEVMSALGEQAPSQGLYNFSFTIMHSPYGPSYLRAIDHKWMPCPSDCRSIVEVSPIGLSWDASAGAASVEEADANGFLAKLHFFTLNPNIEFPLRSQRTGFQAARLLPGWLVNGFRTRLHGDGWLQVFQSRGMSEAYKQKRLANKIEEYRGSFARARPSPTRVESLRKTVRLLKRGGPVHMVRLPVSPPMLKMANGYMPDFNRQMAALARDEGASYFDLTPDSDGYETTDGNHLTQESAKKASARIGALIREESLVNRPADK